MEHALQWYLEECARENVRLPALAVRLQVKEQGGTEDSVRAQMLYNLNVMKESAEMGFNPSLRSMSGLTGGQAYKMREQVEKEHTAGGTLLGIAECTALSIAEYNAAMGRIVAAPTAGACGILPAALLSMQKFYGYSDEQLVDALLVAAVVGDVIAYRASISGAQGGCQAECGSAAAMAAAACVYLRAGTEKMCFDAAGFALMNIMGLVCDPVRGLVEVPCVFRNVSGVAGALAAADLSLSGIPCPLLPDEVIDAMKAVGDALPASLKETGIGGCAGCPSAAKK